MEKKEIVAHAITHAPKGVKGGPYEGPCGIGKAVPSLAEAWRNERAIVREAWRNERAIVRRWLRAVRKRVPTARVIRIVRKARPSVTAREILAYAITHAPPGVKGGPYEADDEGTWGSAAESLRPGHAVRWRARPTQERIDGVLRHVREVHPHARVIRIVRKARPSRLCDACGFLIEAESRRRTPSEARAGEVLRELVAWDEGHPLGEHDIVGIAHRARRVLAASGPDPMPVVRAAMRETEAWDAYLAAPATRSRAETEVLDNASRKRFAAVDAYRKAGGK